MRRGVLLTLLWALALAACGRPLGQGAEGPKMATSSSRDIRHCHEERPTGSNIGRTVCRSDENIDGSRAATREFLTRKRSAPTSLANPTTTDVPNSNPLEVPFPHRAPR